MYYGIKDFFILRKNFLLKKVLSVLKRNDWNEATFKGIIKLQKRMFLNSQNEVSLLEY
jgi:hypothetical protein